MNGQAFPQNQEDLNKNVTLEVLLEYTDEFLAPKIEEIVNNSVGTSEHRMMDYLDRQLTNHTAELFRKLEQKFQTERQFKDKVVDLFKKHNIGTAEDIAFMEGLVKGSW